METYKEFLDRINSFEKSEIDLGDDYFKGSGSIPLKVNEDNIELHVQMTHIFDCSIMEQELRSSMSIFTYGKKY